MPFTHTNSQTDRVPRSRSQPLFGGVGPRERACALVLCFLCGLCVTPLWAAEQEIPSSDTVVDIRIEGNETIPESVILQKIQTQPNRPVSDRLIREDKRQLMGTRWFFSVSERFEDTPAGRVLIFKVHERPIVQKVEFIGNKGVKTKMLAAWTGLKEGSPFDHIANRDAVNRIEQEYKEKGYYFIKVKLVKGGQPGDRDVVFHIEEGPKVRVQHRTFEGNVFWNAGDLKKNLASKEAILWWFGGFYRPETLPQDVEALKQFYRSVGFFDVEVAVDPRFSPDKSAVDLHFTINEGVRYKVRDIRIQGNEVIDVRQLQADAKLHRGEYFNSVPLTKDVRRMLKLYGELGHYFASVVPVPHFTETPGIVDLVIEIDEDRPRYIRNIDVAYDGDYPHTKQTVVWDRMQVFPGDLANPDLIRRSRSRLGGSGLFEPDIQFDVVPVEPENSSFAAVSRSRTVRGQSSEMDAATAWTDQFAEFTRQSAVLSVVGSNPWVPADQTWSSAPRPGYNAEAPRLPANLQESHQPHDGPETRRTAPVHVQGNPTSSLEHAQSAIQNPARAGAFTGSGNLPAEGSTFQKPASWSHPVLRSGEGRIAETQLVPTSVTTHASLLPASQPESGAGHLPGGARPAGGYSGLNAGSVLADSRMVNSRATGVSVVDEQRPPSMGWVESQLTGFRGVTPEQFFQANASEYLMTQMDDPDAPVIRAQSPGPQYYDPAVPGSRDGVLEGSPYRNQFQAMPPGWVDINVRAAEGRTGRLMFGAGVNSDAGLVGSFVWDESNFDLFRPPETFADVLEGRAWRGGGQRFRLEAAPGNQVSRYTLSWTDPYFMYSDYSLTVSGFYFNRFYPDWSEDRLGGRVGVGRQLTPEWSVNAALRLEEVELSNPRTPTPPVVQRDVGRNFLSTVRLSGTHDTRDMSIMPGEGHYADLGYEQAFNEYTYPRVEGEFRQYYTLHSRPDGSGRHVLTLAGNLGWSGDDTPVFERYFAGGFQSFRGFSYRGVAPRQGGVATGGTFQMLGTLEYRLPVTADDMINFVAFTDFGTVEEEVTLSNFRATAGVGMRVVVPAMGPVPLAFDFAFPIKSQAYDDERIFSFYVGVNR